MLPPATATPQACCCSPIRVEALAVAPAAEQGKLPLPKQLVICKWGQSKDLSGAPVIVNATTAAELAANQSKFGYEEIALDFGHNTAPKHGADGRALPIPEPLPIAGYGKLSVEAGTGIIWTATSWTPEGERFYRGRHYRDLSPTVSRNALGEVTFVHSVALTRQGQIPDLHAFAASQTPLPQPSQTPMENDPNYRALACQMAGLSEDCSDEELIAAAAEAQAAIAAAAETPDPEPEPTPEPEPMAAAEPAEDITALSARMDLLERSTLVAAASAAGKVIPLSTEQISQTPISTLQSMIEALPASVPLAAKTPTAEPPTPALAALSAAEQAVCRNLSISAEAYRASNPL